MRFNAAWFDQHLKNIGQKTLWKRSYACACVNPSSGAPDPKHQLCAGKGRIWVEGVESVCGVSKQDVAPELIAAGLFDSGDLQLTIPASSPAWELAGRFDRVVLLNSTDIFSQPFTRGAPNERIIFSVEKVQRCFWLHPTTRQIVEGGIPVVAANGTLSWPGGVGEPPPGTTYSLTGTKFDEYYVLDNLPSDRNEHSGMRLPKRVVMRKFDLFGR